MIGEVKIGQIEGPLVEFVYFSHRLFIYFNFLLLTQPLYEFSFVGHPDFLSDSCRVGNCLLDCRSGYNATTVARSLLYHWSMFRMFRHLVN